MLFIFDLDHTTIDSSHRCNTLSDGSLDLARWRENSTPEMIGRDTLLPLGLEWRDLYSRTPALKIAVITARVMGDADMQYLHDNGLRYDYIYSRTEGDNSPDAALKCIALYSLGRKMGRSIKWMQQFAYFWDDNKKVLEMGSDLGINMLNSTLTNKRLQK